MIDYLAETLQMIQQHQPPSPVYTLSVKDTNGELYITPPDVAKMPNVNDAALQHIYDEFILHNVSFKFNKLRKIYETNDPVDTARSVAAKCANEALASFRNMSRMNDNKKQTLRRVRNSISSLTHGQLNEWMAVYLYHHFNIRLNIDGKPINSHADNFKYLVKRLILKHNHMDYNLL
jgi:hypothetical protein